MKDIAVEIGGDQLAQLPRFVFGFGNPIATGLRDTISPAARSTWSLVASERSGY